MTARREMFAIYATVFIASMAMAQQDPPKVFKLIPAAEPVPCLKYRLLPDLRDQKPGNVIMGYYRAFSPDWQGHRRDPKWYEPVDKAIDMPLAELRGSALAKQLDWVRSSPMLREVNRAARRSYCDWELTERLREDGVGLLIPDVQGFREFARLLTLRSRLEMADGKFDDAAYTLQTGYALARHAGEGPTLIHGLVGIAIASAMNKQVETWVQTPGSPNLYWALTDLPVSFIDLRKCLQGERLLIDNLLPQMREHLKDPARPPFTPVQMRELIAKVYAIMGSNVGSLNETQLFSMALAAAKYGGAKKFLAERGWNAAQIEAMPVLQAVFMQEAFEHERLFDLLARGANLPYFPGQRVLQEGEELLRKEVSGPLMSMPMMAKMLLPAMTKVFLARVRLDRQIAALRTLEAIRLDAAAHEGNLPASLEAITTVPLPIDPITGKAFIYKLSGEKATLTGNVPPGDSPNNVINYEITIGK